ncbi:MAG TPA: ABC transporter substrate-binding protein [Candidatus Binatia bacterium]
MVALESAPAVLDPRYATDANSSLVAALLAPGLTRMDEHAEPVPALAESWVQTSPLDYAFALRPDTRFADGSPLTAADVVATYRSVLDPALRSPKREALAAIADLAAPDPRTVVVRLRTVTASFLETTNLGILPAALAREGQLPPERVLGGGPFRVQRGLSDGGVDLVPAAGVPATTPPGLRFRVIPDGTVRALELASGAVHLVQNALEPDLLPWLRGRADLAVEISPGTTFQYLGMNLRDPRLADVRVRRALAYGLDREAIVHGMLRDTAHVASGLLPPSHWAYSGEVTRYPFDRAQAGALLAESGIGADAAEALRHLSYKTSTVELRRRIAEAVQAQLGALSLLVDVRSYEWATFYADVRRGDFELYSLAWVGVGDPDVYYRIFHSRMVPPEGSNRAAYANPRMDALLEAARATLDPGTRVRLYAEVQRVAADDLPVVPLWWADNVVVHSRRLAGFVPAPDGDLRWLASAHLEPAARAAATFDCSPRIAYCRVEHAP